MKPSQVAKAYGVYPNSVSEWTTIVLEERPVLFAQEGTVAEYERRIAELGGPGSERLLGQKEVEIALPKKLLGTSSKTTEQKGALVETVGQSYRLNQALAAVGLPKSSWYYHHTQKLSCENK